jgi:hypothetical protein
MDLKKFSSEKITFEYENSFWITKTPYFFYYCSILCEKSRTPFLKGLYDVENTRRTWTKQVIIHSSQSSVSCSMTDMRENPVQPFFKFPPKFLPDHNVRMEPEMYPYKISFQTVVF